ncbi:MAG: NAD(P)H-binding protein, partial [Cytophagales bacterium]|nr:NAD(P)H-binding protein [Cytophagales bacterium]
MKVLLTGANGYIGLRLLPLLLEAGHQVICCVRDRRRFALRPEWASQVQVLEMDFHQKQAPLDLQLDAAYYLIHSMSGSTRNFSELEAQSAEHFLQLVEGTGLRQIIFLGGISNEEVLSKHLASRQNVEQVLAASHIPLTVLRAGIIVGSGSASFEIIRDLVEKLPVMVAPRWLNTRCQPIAIRDVLGCLTGVLGRADCLGQTYDIGGSDVLTYNEMLQQFAHLRRLRRLIITLPVLSPRISSYWLYFVTSTSYRLAVNLVDSMKVEVVCHEQRLQQLLGQEPMTYREAVSLAFLRIRQNEVTSSWKDSLISSQGDPRLSSYVEVPTHGCFHDTRRLRLALPAEQVIQNVMQIGGQRGWYY